jgi:2Fe-2S ferredoxin
MDVVTVTFVEDGGTVKTIENAKVGWSLMEIGKANAVDGILGDCGGGCACATCHVYVDLEWTEAVGKPDEVELSALDMVSDVMRPNSRLGCQIKLRPELNGLKVTVAPVA